MSQAWSPLERSQPDLRLWSLNVIASLHCEDEKTMAWLTSPHKIDQAPSSRAWRIRVSRRSGEVERLDKPIKHYCAPTSERLMAHGRYASVFVMHITFAYAHIRRCVSTLP